MEGVQQRLAKLREEEAALIKIGDEIAGRERAGVISRIVEGMRVYHITLAELRAALNGQPAPLPIDLDSEAGNEPKRRRAEWTPERREAQRQAFLKRAERVMYRDNKGNEWNGLRQPPQWIKEWESKPGRSRDHWLTDEFKQKPAKKARSSRRA
jgi:hypothetical protein